MTTTLRLPTASGTLEDFRLDGRPLERPSRVPAFNRVAFAAAHVVADPLAAGDPSSRVAIDWEATLRFRDHLFAHGFAVAEAMDTAQRGMGLDWPNALELIRRSVANARSHPGALVFSGCGTDQLDPAAAGGIEDVVAAYEEQVEAVQEAGGRVIMMASRALAKVARGPEDYALVYERVLGLAERPVILHWLGEMFDPALRGYWGSEAFADAMTTCLGIIEANAAKIDGIKVSLLDAEKEVVMRRRLPHAVRMYTGDDFNYPELIKGDGRHHSDALLGIFDPIAPAAAIALEALARGDVDRFDAVLAPTVPLSRKIFESPTRFYKTGVVFLAWLNGHQEHFTMLGGQQSMRSLPHLALVFRLADAAGLLADPELATARMKRLLALHGVHG